MNFQLSDLLKTTRQYFWQQNFTEVEIPYLNSSLPLEPNIYSFDTVWKHTHTKFYLPASPEFALKKYLAENKTNCFAISHCFRDLEAAGPYHTPEFLMLEWYEINQTLIGLMESVEKYLSLFIKNLKFKTLNLPDNLPDNEPDFNQYFLNSIEPNLPKDSAVFITGYPSYLSPLAAVGTDPGVCSFNKKVCSSLRFELYINGVEIANGCTENRNSQQIKHSFAAEKKYRLDRHLPLHPASIEFADLCSQMPPCSGIGLGLDRLSAIINHGQRY